jgi:hypothetical protein
MPIGFFNAFSLIIVGESQIWKEDSPRRVGHLVSEVVSSGGIKIENRFRNPASPVCGYTSPSIFDIAPKVALGVTPYATYITMC